MCVRAPIYIDHLPTSSIIHPSSIYTVHLHLSLSIHMSIIYLSFIHLPIYLPIYLSLHDLHPAAHVGKNSDPTQRAYPSPEGPKLCSVLLFLNFLFFLPKDNLMETTEFSSLCYLFSEIKKFIHIKIISLVVGNLYLIRVTHFSYTPHSLPLCKDVRQ